MTFQQIRYFIAVAEIGSVEEAAKQIISTDEKINRIAENVGYKDSDYFIRKFIEIMGCTPSKYRKTNRGE